MNRTAILLATFVLAAAGCAPAPVPEGDATESRRIDCGVPHCSLRLPPGVVAITVRDDDRRVLEHRATGVRMHVRVLETEPVEPGGIPSRLARLLDREAARLAPAVRFSQPPQGPLGIVVRSVSGTLQDGRDPTAEQGTAPQPVRMQLLTFTSPATGRVLVLRAAGSEPQWSRAWPELRAVTRDLRLEAGF